VTLTTPISGMTVISRLGLATINLQTKFEVSNYIHSEDMKSGAKWRNWGSLERLGVTKVSGNVTIRLLLLLLRAFI